MKNMFPNLHINVLFQAEGCAPIVAEIQIHHEDVLAVTKQDHKLYEVIRAKSIAALAGAKQNITINQVVEETEVIKAKDAELAALREEIERLRKGGHGQGVDSIGGAGINAARSLRR